MVTGLLLPLADVAAAGFQFISAWEALRGFGQYVQYNPPADPTNPSWTSALPTSVAGYPINNVQVLCGDTAAGAACTSTNIHVAHQVLFLHDDRHLGAVGVELGVVSYELHLHADLLRTVPVEVFHA